MHIESRDRNPDKAAAGAGPIGIEVSYSTVSSSDSWGPYVLSTVFSCPAPAAAAVCGGEKRKKVNYKWGKR